MKSIIAFIGFVAIVCGFVACSHHPTSNSELKDSEQEAEQPEEQSEITLSDTLETIEDSTIMSVDSLKDSLPTVADTIPSEAATQVTAPVEKHGEKWALVIGIGHYENKIEGNKWKDINGDKDVGFVDNMLKECGYKEENIIKLVDSKATKAGIERAFKTLADSCHKGDTVYVQISGHGQLVKTQGGNDEHTSWIPYDAYPNNKGNYDGTKHLIDYEVNDLLYNVYEQIGDEGKLLVVVDACHSEGGGTKGGDFLFRGALTKYEFPSSVNLRKPRAEKWIVIGACGKKQINYEIPFKNGSMGRLTCAICSIIREKGYVEKGDIEKFYNDNKHFPQTPVITNPTNYKIEDVLKVNK